MAKARKPKAKRKRPAARRPGTRHGTAAKKRAFLAAFGKLGNISAAAEGLIDRSTVYEWRRTDEVFTAAFELAKEDAGDRLEEEARRRAVEGWEEPVFQQGHRVGHWEDAQGNVVSWKDERAVAFIPASVRKYSDTLLALLLKGNKPEKYRERFEHTGKDGKDLLAGTLAELVKSARG